MYKLTKISLLIIHDYIWRGWRGESPQNGAPKICSLTLLFESDLKYARLKYNDHYKLTTRLGIYR